MMEQCFLFLPFTSRLRVYTRISPRMYSVNPNELFLVSVQQWLPSLCSIKPKGEAAPNTAGSNGPAHTGTCGHKARCRAGLLFRLFHHHINKAQLYTPPSSSFRRLNKRQLQVARQTRGNNGAHPHKSGLYPRTREQMYTHALGHAPLLPSPLAR